MVSVLVRAGALVLLGSALGVVLKVAQSEPLAFVAEPVTACEAAPLTVEAIAPEDAAALCASQHVLIIDVRSEEEFALGHIAGALHLPCSQGSLKGASTQLDNAEFVLVYGRGSEDAQPVAKSLIEHGWPVKFLSGGYEAWASLGLACTSGTCAGCDAMVGTHGH